MIGIRWQQYAYFLLRFSICISDTTHFSVCISAVLLLRRMRRPPQGAKKQPSDSTPPASYASNRLARGWNIRSPKRHQRIRIFLNICKEKWEKYLGFYFLWWSDFNVKNVGIEIVIFDYFLQELNNLES